MDRAVLPEFVDDQSVGRDDLNYIMSYLRGINRRLGGVHALLSHLRRWSVGWKRGTPVTLLDVATGTADLPVQARKWAESGGFDLRITGVDVSAAMLELARAHVVGTRGIELVQCDARSLLDRFGPASFDYVHTGLFLHHLQDEGVVDVLRAMKALARRGLVWNDLIRTRRGLAVTWLFTLGRRRVLRHDACASIRAGFTADEVRTLCDRAGLTGAEYRGRISTHRFTLSFDQPAAATVRPEALSAVAASAH